MKGIVCAETPRAIVIYIVQTMALNAGETIEPKADARGEGMFKFSLQQLQHFGSILCGYRCCSNYLITINSDLLIIFDYICLKFNVNYIYPYDYRILSQKFQVD